MDAVPLSFYIITLSSSFEDAIRLAISHGDDGDTCEKVHQKIENDKNDFDKNDKVSRLFVRFLKVII